MNASRASFFVSEGDIGEQAPEGSHPARCIAVVDLGTQTSEFNGEMRSRRALWVQWELPGEARTTGNFAGEVFRVGSIYTRSLHPKSSLRADLESWRGKSFTPDELKQFDIARLLGSPCLLQVGRNEKGRARVNAVMSLPKGMTVPAAVNDPVLLSLDAFDMSVYADLPKGIQAMVASSPEYATATGRPSVARDNAANTGQTTGNTEPAAVAAAAAAAAGGGDFDDFADDDIPF